MDSVLEVPEYDLATSVGGGDPGVVTDFFRLLASTQPVALRGKVTGFGELGFDVHDAPVHPRLAGVLFGVEAHNRVPPDGAVSEGSDKATAGPPSRDLRVDLSLEGVHRLDMVAVAEGEHVLVGLQRGAIKRPEGL